MKKLKLFQNLLISLNCLHMLGEYHLEINPKNIWVEDELLVYLRPFKLHPNDILSSYAAGMDDTLTLNQKFHYISPEFFFANIYNRSKQNMP